MSPHLQRARLLREHNRHEEAVGLLHQHLAADPDDAQGHVELALNRLDMPGHRQLAVDDIQRAISLEPDTAWFHALHAVILSRLDREDAALAAADRALAIDPEHDFGWYAKALAHSGKSQWKEAEAAIRQALTLDPDNATYSNLLSHVLRMQNRLAESEQETMRRIARDPENAWSFANAGWSALQRHDVQTAENHFKEALRLDPEFEHAREGLKESFRARSPIYRLFLRWYFFMARHSESSQGIIAVAIIFGFRIVRKIAAAIHPMLLVAVVFAFYLFMFGTWIAKGLANFMLMKDPIARLSLDRGEKAEGLAVGVLFFSGLALLVGGMVAKLAFIAAAGTVLLAVTIPITMIFTNDSKKGQGVFTLCALGILALGFGGVMGFVRQPGLSFVEGAGEQLAFVLLLTAAVSWMAMIPALRRAKPD